MKKVLLIGLLAFPLMALAAQNNDPRKSCPGPDQETFSCKADVHISCDPNEMSGPVGVGEKRYVKAGDWMDYTIYFENATNATAAAINITVTLPKDANLDWSTLELGEVAFGDHTDTGLVEDKAARSSKYGLADSGCEVRTTVTESDGDVTWNLRIWDPTTGDHYPDDFKKGVLPPNDPDTHCGEGHISYRVKVKEDATPNSVIHASASIVFDDNPAIETDPSWWNTVTPVGQFLKAGEYVKLTLAELGYDVPTDGTPYNVVAKGLPAGLKLVSNKAVTKKVKGKTVVVKAAKSEWWIEGVPTAPLDFMTNPPYLVITAAGTAAPHAEALPIEVAAQEVTELEDLALGQSVNTNGWLAGVGAGWTVSGLPTGLKYATKKVTKKSGKKTVTVAEAYAVYGKTTKAGLFTITAKKKVGAYYETMKYRVLVRPKAVDVAVFGEELTNIVTMAYVPVEWDLTGGGRGATALPGGDGHAGRVILPVVSNVVKVAGLPSGVTFVAATTYKDKAKKQVKQYGQTIVGKPTKPGTYVVTFTKNVTTGSGKNKKTVAKTAQILWKVVPNDAELELAFNTAGGVVESGVVGLKYGDLLAFTATSNATVTASGLPAGMKLVRLEGGSGHAGRVTLPGEVAWGFDGFTAKAGTYLVTVKATLNGRSVTQRLALVVEGLPAWAKGTFNGYVSGGGHAGRVTLPGGANEGLATITVGSAGKISGKFQEDGTNWTFSAACYTAAARSASAPYQADDWASAPYQAFACSNVVAKYAYKATETVKGKKKTVTKSFTRTFALTVAPDPEFPDKPVRGVVAMEEVGGRGATALSDGGSIESTLPGTEIEAWQNLWGSTYKAVGKALFSTKSGKKTLAYKTFAVEVCTNEVGEVHYVKAEGDKTGLGTFATLSLKVTTAGVVTATLTYDTGKTTKDKKTKKTVKVYYKPACTTVVVPTSAPDAATFTGEVPVFFAPSSGSGFGGFAGSVPF